MFLKGKEQPCSRRPPAAPRAHGRTRAPAGLLLVSLVFSAGAWSEETADAELPAPEAAESGSAAGEAPGQQPGHGGDTQPGAQTEGGDAAVPVDAVAPDEGEAGSVPAAPTVEVTPASDPVNDYLGAIDRAEARSHAYSTELADLYLGLGQSLLERGEFEDAKLAFQQGMQIVRVNYGLNAQEQNSYLFSIADIEGRTGNWKGADQVMQSIYTLNARAVGVNHPDMLPILNQQISFYMQHRPQRTPDQSYWNLVRSEVLASRMAYIIEQEWGLGHPDTAAIYRRIGQLHYFMAEQLSRHDVDAQPGLSFSTSSPAASQTAYGVSIHTHFVGGRDAYEKVAQSVGLRPDRTPREHAEAIAQLGDWFLIFGKNQTATKSYQQAYTVLAQSNQAAELTAEFFGQPAPLRFLRNNPGEHPGQPDIPAANMVEVSMTVTRTGRPQQVRILKPPADMEKNQVRRMERRIREMRFRPRLVEGLPQETEQFIWHYEIRGMEG